MNLFSSFDISVCQFLKNSTSPRMIFTNAFPDFPPSSSAWGVHRHSQRNQENCTDSTEGEGVNRGRWSRKNSRLSHRHRTCRTCGTVALQQGCHFYCSFFVKTIVNPICLFSLQLNPSASRRRPSGTGTSLRRHPPPQCIWRIQALAQ